MKIVPFEARYPKLKNMQYIYNNYGQIIFRVCINDFDNKAIIDVDKRYDVFTKCTSSKEDFEFLWQNTTPVWDYLFEFSFINYIIDRNFKSIILQLSPQKYMYIGYQIFEFISLDPILYYKDSVAMTKDDLIDLLDKSKHNKGIKSKIYFKMVYS